MGSSQPSEEVTVSVDGITVVKRFEEDEFPVPAIAFEFRSARDEPVTVRLRDAVPDGVAVEDLGFHPEYGSEYWTVDDGGISFERELGAGAEYTTVYGIRATETEDIEQFLVEPTIEAVDPPLPEGAGDADVDAEVAEVDVVPGDQEAVKEAIAGDGTVPGLEEEEDAEADDEEAETLDLEEPTAEAGEADTEPSGDTEPAGDAEAAEGGAGDTDGESEEAVPEADAEAAAAADTRLVDDGEETAAETGEAESEAAGGEPEPAIRERATDESAGRAGDGSLIEALAAEVREGEVPEEDVETLREALGATEAVDGTTEARIRQLQRDVSDLRAYTDALDEFLDENGTAQQVLEDARDQIDSFEQQLAEFEGTVERVEREADEATTRSQEAESEVDTLRTEVDEVHDVVADVEDDVEEVEEDVEDVQEDVEDVEGDVEGVAEDVEDVAGDVDEVRTGVDDVRDDIEELETGLEGAESSIADLEARAETFEEDLEELTEEVHEGDLEGRVEEMESTLEDLQEWQTQIKETFGGG